MRSRDLTNANAPAASIWLPPCKWQALLQKFSFMFKLHINEIISDWDEFIVAIIPSLALLGSLCSLVCEVSNPKCNPVLVNFAFLCNCREQEQRGIILGCRSTTLKKARPMQIHERTLTMPAKCMASTFKIHFIALITRIVSWPLLTYQIQPRYPSQLLQWPGQVGGSHLPKGVVALLKKV